MESRAVHDPPHRVLSTCTSDLAEGSPWGENSAVVFAPIVRGPKACSCDSPAFTRGFSVLETQHGRREAVFAVQRVPAGLLRMRCHSWTDFVWRESRDVDSTRPNSSKPFFSPWPEPVERGFSYVTDETNLTGGGATSGTGRCELTGPAAVAPDPVMLGLRSGRAW